MLEIERKFLVNSLDFVKDARISMRIVQGFLNTHPERTVRVRIKKNKGFITVKGLSNTSGTSRIEWERDIPLDEAEMLLKLCEPGIIDKTRYEVSIGNHIYEIDIFEGDNKGLVIAEIELSSEDEYFEKPSWLGQEVTGEIKYYNSQLSKHPYNLWEEH